MSIRYVQQGNMFDSPAQAFVIPVNCVGVAGCGVALQARQRYPEWFARYRACCQSGQLWTGRPLLHWGMEPMMVSFPTKNDYRHPSQLVYVEQGLQGLVRLCEYHGIASLGVPKLGTGAGGLAWRDVGPLMERYLGALACSVYVYV